MKKFILGLSCGIVLTGSSAAFAASAIKAVWFPVSYEINGSTVPAGSSTAVNIEGQAYVPLRFIAESLGATIGYDVQRKSIQVKNAALDLTDPDCPDITAGNLILTKSGNSTLVTGQLKLANVGSTLNKITATLSFYNDNSKKIGQISINGDRFGVDAQTFSVLGAGDFRDYSAAILQVEAVNGQALSRVPAVTYENSRHQFTLQLPAFWEGKYSIRTAVHEVSKNEAYTFVDTANQEYGGDVFTVLVWSRQAWSEAGANMMEVGRIWKLGEQGDKVFTLNPPGDVQYNTEDMTLTEEYMRMSSYLDQIRISFKLLSNNQ